MSDEPQIGNPEEDKPDSSDWKGSGPEIYLDLAKLAQQSFENRRIYEWKVAFGLWTGLGAFTYFAIQYAAPLPTWAILCLAVTYVGTAAIWGVIWQPSLRTAHDCDKAWKHYYMHRAEDRPSNRRARDPWRDETKRPPYETRDEIRVAWKQPWTWAQTGVTVVFLFMSFILIVCKSSPPPTPQTQDRITVSGDDVTKVIDKLTE